MVDVVVILFSVTLIALLFILVLNEDVPLLNKILACFSLILCGFCSSFLYGGEVFDFLDTPLPFCIPRK